MSRLDALGARAAHAIPLGDLAMDLILATAGAQWMAIPVPCEATGCARMHQAVRQTGPRTYIGVSCGPVAR